MADEKVTFAITAQDKATATVKRLKGELGMMGGAAGGAVGPLGKLSAVTGGYITPAGLAIGGTVALGAAFLGAARAAMDEERGVALLTAALKANDPAAVSNIGNIEQTIKERQKLAFADDEQRESLGALIAVTKDSGKALTLQRTAMDLARLKGMDLNTATTLLGKVYGGNIGILARYGIQLEKGTTATEAIAEIQRRAAGQAEAYADTTNGAMESMMLAFDDVVEDIGAALLPALTAVAIYVRDELIPALRDVAAVVGPVLGTIADGVRVLNDAVRPSTESMESGFDGLAAAALRSALGVDTASTKISSSVENSEGAARDSMVRMAETMAQAGARIAADWAIRAESIPQAVRDRWAAMRAAGLEGQVQYALGILDGQTGLKAEIDATLRAVSEHLAPGEEISFLQGQLVELGLARGIAVAKGDNSAVAAVDALVGKVKERLSGLDGGPGGTSVIRSWTAGMTAEFWRSGGSAYQIQGLVGTAASYLGRSLPTAGPLKGGVAAGGESIVQSWFAGMSGAARRGMSGLQNAVSGVSSALVPAFGAMTPAFAGGGGFGGAPAGGGLTINFNSTFPTTPAQAQAVAQTMMPEWVREMRRQGLLP